jgi:hypothetical protein
VADILGLSNVSSLISLSSKVVDMQNLVWTCVKISGLTVAENSGLTMDQHMYSHVYHINSN